MKLFKEREKHTKDNGIIVTKYDPQTDIFIDSINIETGDVEEKQITEYSKHENLVMYKIHDPESRFKDFWVSEDHSMIIYDVTDDTYKKETPKNLPDPSKYLVQQHESGETFFIASDLISIGIDSNHTVGYDFTVSDNYTFCTDDGVFIQDTMTLYTPVTKEAIEEAKDKMLTSKSPKGLHSLTEDFSKDVVVGIYTLTKDSVNTIQPILVRSDDDVNDLDIYDRVKYNGISTTAGRIIFNRGLPEKYPFLNESINKKKVNSLAKEIFETYDKDEYIRFCHNMVSIGMKYFTVASPSFTMDDMKIPPSIIKLKAKLKLAKTPEEAHNIIEEMERLLEEYLIKSGSNLGLIGEAGGLKGGNYGQVRQILVAKGLIQDTEGNPMAPIAASYSDGLQSKEYFDSGIGSRSGIVDRVINTADTGYLSRQLVSVLQRVEADPGIKDCGTTRTVKMNVTPDIAKRLEGRSLVTDDGKVERFNPKDYIGKEINLRSPVYCTSTRICYTCYGDLLYRNKTHYVGVLAGHLLGEPLTQSIMRTFHSGGSISMSSLDVLAEMSKSMTSDKSGKLRDMLIQKESDIYCKTEGTMVLDRNNYLDDKNDIEVGETELKLKYGYFTLNIGGETIEVTLDKEMYIPLKDKEIEIVEPKLTIKFPVNSLIFSIPPQAEAFKNQVKMVKMLLSGKQPWKNGDHFLMKLYDFYESLIDADMVHLEILASNLLRDKGNPSHPARLNKNYQPIVVGMKSIPALESWLQSINFEDINKSITQGLLYDRPEQETILERITSGNL